MTKRAIAFLLCIILLLGTLPAAGAADEPKAGPVVMSDPDSPTGYTGRFTYYDPNASQVYFCGDLNLSNFADRSDTKTYSPAEYKPGLTRRGGSQFKQPMQKLDGGYWYYELPLAAGANQYWFNVGSSSRMMPDPANAPVWSPNSSATKDAYNCVYVPYDEKQDNELLKAREVELPRETEKGSWEYVPYKVGSNTFYMGVYLPYGYDADRDKPYKTIYLVHGWGQDESDWMGIGSAPNIMDNLIAEGRTEAAVVISLPNNNNSIGSQNDKYATLFNTVLPFVEENYNVSGDAKDRALAGLSMGSRYTRAVMETDPESFGYYGLFSCSETITPSTPNLDKAHILIGVGVFDGANYQNATTTNTQNMEKGGFFSKTLNVAGAHDFNTWSQLLRMFAEDYLWKPAAFGEKTGELDTAALQTAIDRAQAIDQSLYTALSVDRMLTALVAALNAMDAPSGQEEIDAATALLQNAIAALEEKPVLEKSALAAAVEAAEKLERDKYTSVTFHTLENRLQYAKKMLEEAEIQEQIDDALDSLNRAIAALEEKTPVDKTALQEAVAAAEAMDKTPYTEASLDDLAETLQTVKSILENATSQVDVDYALDLLNGSLDRLVRKDAPIEPFLFEDVKDEGKFFYAPVYWAFNAEPQITNGTDATHFGPDVSCTRAQVVTFLWRAAGCPEPEKSSTGFTDLSAGAFYETAVAWAVEQGITKGMSGTTFAPNATCTRGQIVTFLWRFKGSPAPVNAKTPFVDVEDKAFYAQAVAWAVENEVTNGMSRTAFAPNATCTRGQVVTFLYRAMQPEKD